MLQELEPWEFDERYAQYRLQPWGHETEVFSAVGAEIINAIHRAVGSQEKPLEPDYFVPKAKRNTAQESSTGTFFATMRNQILRGS